MWSLGVILYILLSGWVNFLVSQIVAYHLLP
jgi:hypothetical protein